MVKMYLLNLLINGVLMQINEIYQLIVYQWMNMGLCMTIQMEWMI